MSSPPDQPPNQPNPPLLLSKNNKRMGAFVAIAAVVLISLMAELLGRSGIALGAGAGLIAVPVVSLACVILGSILTISQNTRQFAVGLLITSAVLLFVTAGACAVLVITIASQL